MGARRCFLKFATCFVVSLGLCAIALPPATALAAEPGSASTCPTPEAVAAAVRALIRPEVTPPRLEAEIAVIDAGARFTVSIRGRQRDYADKARDCRERTRTAAVFVALTLSPPDIGSGKGDAALDPATAEPGQAPSAGTGADPANLPQADPASPKRAAASDQAPAESDEPASKPTRAQSAPQRPAPATKKSAPPSKPARGKAETSRSGSSALAVELGLLGALAPRSDSVVLVAGGDLRGAFTWRGWGISLGFALPSPSTLELDQGLRVEQQRLVGDASGRLIWQAERLSGALDLGVLVANTRLTRQGATPVEGDRSFELGLRAAASIELSSAISPFFRVFSEYVPVSREIAVEPRGVIGDTPPFWLGASLGVSGKFR